MLDAAIIQAIIIEPEPGPEIGLKEVVLRCVEAALGTSLPSSGEEWRVSGNVLVLLGLQTRARDTLHTRYWILVLDTAPASYWVSGNFNSSKTARRASNFLK